MEIANSKTTERDTFIQYRHNGYMLAEYMQGEVPPWNGHQTKGSKTTVWA